MASDCLSGFYGSPGDEYWGGPKVREFEAAWRERYGVAHAVSVNSATSGLFAAMGAIGISPGDEVIIPPWTMSATAMAPWSAQYHEGHPFLTADAAVFLRDAGAVIVGIDSFNIDDTADKSRPVHTTLLRAGIPVVEHLCGLEQLPVTGFRFSAIPVKVKGMGTFPVRAYANVTPRDG